MAPDTKKLFQITEAAHACGLSRSTLYQYIKDGDFPKPVRLGLRAVGWLESDISEWIAARVKGARQGNAPAAR